MLPGGLLYNFRFHQPDVLVAEEVCQTTATYFERLKSLDDQRPARVEQKLGITIQTVFVLGAYWNSGSFSSIVMHFSSGICRGMQMKGHDATKDTFSNILVDILSQTSERFWSTTFPPET